PRGKMWRLRAERVLLGRSGLRGEPREGEISETTSRVFEQRSSRNLNRLRSEHRGLLNRHTGNSSNKTARGLELPTPGFAPVPGPALLRPTFRIRLSPPGPHGRAPTTARSHRGVADAPGCGW